MKNSRRSYWILPVVIMIFLAFGLFTAGLAVRLAIILYGHPPINEVRSNG